MNKISILLIVVGLSVMIHAAEALERFTTSVGAEFSMVEDSRFGKIWQSPDGKRWSKAVGFFKFQDALNECKKLGAEVPSLEQYHELRNYFEKTGEGSKLTERGLSELHQIFPDLKSYSYFWTATLVPGNRSLVFILDGVYGTLGSGVMETYIPVYTQCVRVP